jgi:hypothetical protein
MSSVFYIPAPKITHLSDIPRPIADPSMSPIHRGAWKDNSANFA